MKITRLEKIEILVFYFLFVVGFHYIISKLSVSFSNINISFPGSIGYINLYSFWILVILIILMLIIKQFHKKENFGFKHPKEYKSVIYFFFLLMPIAFIGRIFDPSFDIWYAQAVGLDFILGTMLFVATMPFFVIKEELIERSIIQKRFQKAYGFWITLFAVSLNFAIAHINLAIPTQHTTWQVVSVFFGSFILVTYFFITRNIWLSTLLHLIYNVAISFQIYFHATNKTYELIFWVVYGLGFLIFFKPALSMIKAHIPKFKIPRLHAGEWAFIAIFTVLLPLVILLVQYR